MNKNKLQSGQVVILLAISMVVLLGFTALAIDGSLLYSDRRQLQTAADAAALAGAGAAGNYLAENNIKSGDWVCDGSVIPARTAAVNQAIIVAGTNGSAITFGTGENTVHTECVGSFLDYGPKYIDVIVTITDDTKTSLVHFVYQGEVKNTVKAIARVYASSSIGMGNSIISLNESCESKGGIRFAGGGTQDTKVILTGGGAYSHSCIWFDGGVYVDAGDDGSILYTDSTDYDETRTNIYVNPPPDKVEIVMPPIIIEPPKCTNDPYEPVANNPTSLSAGNYQGITVTNSDLVLSPGLYCLTGDFSISGGSVTGNGVTIYLINGGYKISGNPTITLTAPEVGCEYTPPADGCPPAIGGLLIYHNPTGTGSVIQIEGSGGSTYSGTVYAPKSDISIGGTSGTSSDDMIEAGVQAIGYNVKIHGNADVNIPYNEDALYHSPTKLDLFK
jgi:hypothetical protein